MSNRNLAINKRFKPAGFHNVTHSYNMSVDENLSDLKRSSYWSLCTRGVSVGDFIIITKEDNSFVAEAYVISKKENVGLKIVILREHNLEDCSVNDEYSKDDFIINYAATQKHRIIYKGTGDILEKGFSTKKEAEQYLEDYLKK